MSATVPIENGSARVRVWDLPTRITHWVLVLLVATSWWSADSHHMDYHRYSGYGLLGLLVFRVYWGIFGSHTARFSHFVKGPRIIWRYVRARAHHASPGHNPLGALSVLGLLGLLLSQVTLGLFSVDVDGVESGPWSRFVSFEVGRACAHCHHAVFNVLLGFIALHLGAVLFYWIVKRDNLVGPMLTGWKSWAHRHDYHASIAPWWLAALGVALSAVVVTGIVR
jgi:cytochrome b